MSIDIFKRLINGQAKVAPESEDQLFSPELPQTNWVCFDGATLAELGFHNPQLWNDPSGWGTLKNVQELASGRAVWVEYGINETLERLYEDGRPLPTATAFGVAFQAVPNTTNKLSALVVYGGKKPSEPLIITAAYYITLDDTTGAVTSVEQTYARVRDVNGDPIAPWEGRRDLFFGVLPLIVGDQASTLGYAITQRNARRFVRNLHSRDKKKRKAAQKKARFHYYEVLPAVGVVKSDKIVASDELSDETTEDTEE